MHKLVSWITSAKRRTSAQIVHPKQTVTEPVRRFQLAAASSQKSLLLRKSPLFQNEITTKSLNLITNVKIEEDSCICDVQHRAHKKHQWIHRINLSTFVGMAGARAAMDMARGSAEHLSKLAEQILEKVPEAENWEPVRKFLQVSQRAGNRWKFELKQCRRRVRLGNNTQQSTHCKALQREQQCTSSRLAPELSKISFSISRTGKRVIYFDSRTQCACCGKETSPPV